MAHPTKPHLLARRLWLDLLGRHPQPDEWQTATQQIETGQLAALVDRLLETKAFSKRAGEEIAGWIANASQIKSPAERSAQLIDSIADFLQSSDNVRELAREMLSVQEPRATRLNAFHTFASDPRSRAELVASVFMGVRIGCAQCHDHPLDRWTQDDYFAMAACWSEIDAGMQIKRIAGRTTTDLRSGRVAIARLPYSDVAYTAEEPADLAFANWICGEQNHFFAPNIVNRIWFWLMGEGLVDDVDDHRPTNPAINPELLEYLSIQLTENQGSLRSLVRQIVLSDAYARESDRSAERLAHRLCAIRIPRAIRQPMAELAIQALGISDRDELPETNHQESMMLQPVLEPGCSRGHPCSDPVSDSLSLVAGHDLNAAVRTAVRTASTSAQGVAPDSLQSVQLLQEFHLRLYGQEMPAADRDKWERAFATMPTATQQEMVEDILWSWIVSPNFSLLH